MLAIIADIAMKIKIWQAMISGHIVTNSYRCWDSLKIQRHSQRCCVCTIVIFGWSVILVKDPRYHDICMAMSLYARSNLSNIDIGTVLFSAAEISRSLSQKLVAKVSRTVRSRS
jgi:hypothetical protein